MRCPAALLLLLCACVARPTDDDPDETTDGETTDADESTTLGTTVSSATVTVTTGTTPTLTFYDDIQPIFDEHCVAACHEPGGEWGALLDLSSSAYEAIVGVPSPQFFSMSIIEPGEPGASYLWHKLNGTQTSVGGSGIDMPKARTGMTATVLSQEQLDMIEQWILQGAPP